MWGRGEQNKPHIFKDSKQTSKISNFASLLCTGNNNSKTLSQTLKQKFVYEDVHHIEIVKKNQTYLPCPAIGNWFNNGGISNKNPSDRTYARI